MLYKILPYTFKKAEKMNLVVEPSENPKYKLEIYDAVTGKFLFYGGSASYLDYPHYIETKGLSYANERRRLYRIRHAKEIAKVGSRGAVIAELLW